MTPLACILAVFDSKGTPVTLTTTLAWRVAVEDQNEVYVIVAPEGAGLAVRILFDGEGYPEEIDGEEWAPPHTRN